MGIEGGFFDGFDAIFKQGVVGGNFAGTNFGFGFGLDFKFYSGKLDAVFVEGIGDEV